MLPPGGCVKRWAARASHTLASTAIKFFEFVVSLVLPSCVERKRLSTDFTASATGSLRLDRC